MKTNPSFSFKWATILFNYKDYQIKYRNGMWSSIEEIWVNDELNTSTIFLEMENTKLS